MGRNISRRRAAAFVSIAMALMVVGWLPAPSAWASPAPGATALLDCDQGGVVLQLTNTGDAPASFTLLVDSSDVPLSDLDPGRVRSELVAVAEDTTVHITLTSGGQTLIDEDFVRNCTDPVPSATATIDCTRGGVVVTITNNTTIPVDYTVTRNTVVVASDTVAGNGATAEVLVPFAEDETATVDVTSGGSSIFGPQTFTRDCPPPATRPKTAAKLSCAQGGALVRIVNNTTSPVDYRILKGKLTSASGSLPINGRVSTLVPFAEDETASIRVTAGGTTIFGPRRFTQNCS
jgi:hypothetical protein